MNVEIRSEIETRSQLEKEFNLILRRIINESLKNIGKGFDSVVYYVLNQKYNVKEEEIPEHIAEFSNCLQTVFGKEGRMFIEKIITMNLYIKIRESYDRVQEKQFIKRVEHAKYKYFQKKKI